MKLHLLDIPHYKGELDKAINYFNIAIEKGGDIPQCRYMISNCLKKKDRFQDALEQIELALKHAKLKSSRLHYSKFRLLNNLCKQRITYANKISICSYLCA